MILDFVVISSAQRPVKTTSSRGFLVLKRRYKIRK